MHWHLAKPFKAIELLKYVSKKYSAKSFTFVNNDGHKAGTLVKLVKIRHFYSHFTDYNPPSKIRPGGTEAQQGYSIAYQISGELFFKRP